jgi:glycosyltransferase involved in cell wall biosynthesis
VSARPPRVVHLTSAHSIDDVRIFHKECRALARAGFDLVLVGPGKGKTKIEDVSIRVVPVTGGRLRRMTITVWDLFVGALVSRATVCHFHDPELIPAGFLLKLLGRRVIYDVHEDCPRDILTKDWIPAIIKRPLAVAMSAVERAAGWAFDAIVAATPTIADRFPAGKTITVRNVPILEEFSETSEAEYAGRPFQVCYVGLLGRWRGLFDMIEAAGRVGNGATQCLLLAGRFAGAVEEAECRNAPAWRNVTYLGWLDRPRLARLLGRVRAGLVVLHPKASLVDAYPTKMFEYMAAGLPVVAADFPLYREILDDGRCGILVPPADPAALARAIEWIFGQPGDAQAMGQRGRRRVEALYTWTAEREKLLRLYRRLAGPR